MKLVSFRQDDESPVEAGVVVEDRVVPARTLFQIAREKVEVLAPAVLRDMDHVPLQPILDHWSDAQAAMAGALGRVKRSPTLLQDNSLHFEEVYEQHPPLQRPPSIRDFYAFEEHVARSWERRGEPVPEAWYELPVFYFSNPSVVYGPEQRVPKPASTKMMDFELEVGWVIGENASNLEPYEAERAIVGLTILNDWSARDLQRQEMSVGLGPAKGKDFATSLGPMIVTLDELDSHKQGKAYDLRMTARVNGEEVSRGRLSDIHWGLGEMTAFASRDARIVPGDVMGTGTVGTGSVLDLGSDDWLEPGDVVELEVEHVGTLRNTVGEPTQPAGLSR